jgi:tetratricopeptide (TPR) repeat protein
MWRSFFPLFFSVVLTVAAQTAQSPQALIDDAIAKQRAGDFEGAVKGYKEFLKQHPEAAAIHSNLGASLAGLGQFEEAIREYKTALKQSPGLPGLRLNLALAYYKTGRIGDAVDELVRVHKESPDNSQATLLLADCYFRMGQNKDVIRILQPEEERHPDDLAVAYLLGTALIRDDKPAEGQVLVDRILRNGDSAEAHLMLGTAKIQAADFAGARDELAKALALNPNLPGVHVLYAHTLQVTSGPEEAMKEFQAELAIDPYNFDSNLQIGAMLRKDQNYDDAKPYLMRALATRPGDLAVRYQLAAIALSEGKADEARRELESIVKESPQFTEAHVTLSIAYFRLKRPEDGNREKSIVERLTAEAQAKQPGVKAQ